MKGTVHFLATSLCIVVAWSIIRKESNLNCNPLSVRIELKGCTAYK
jgi:hypothetical protein